MSISKFDKEKLILVTGVTGYVGNRLVYRLLGSGFRLRVFTRDLDRVRGKPWFDQVEVVVGDALDREALDKALSGVAVAYFLIHGRQIGPGNVERDSLVARNFADAASKAGLERIIYLGELVDPQAKLSDYLRSRHETGYTLRLGQVPVTEFRAGVIVGSGSALFEMMRVLVEREPMLVCPKWFFAMAHPIAIRNVLDYLESALSQLDSVGKLIEIGGLTKLSYADMMREYANARGLKRFLIPTPFYFPRLSAYWVHLITPISYNTVLPLIEGLHLVCMADDHEARELFPEIELLTFAEAVKFAMLKIENGDIQSSFRDALVTSAGDIQPYHFQLVEGMYVEQRHLLVPLPAEKVYKAYCSIGGERGWLYMDWSWKIRGWMDKVVGGVGLRRGRRHPTELRVGDSLDFWRVESLSPNRSLLLQAEMKVPGKAWLEFESVEQENSTMLITTAFFDARGFWGLIYWVSMWPFHKFIFDGVTREIAKLAGEIE